MMSLRMKTAERLLGDGQMGTEQIDRLRMCGKIRIPAKASPGPQGWFSWRTLDLPSPKRLRAGRAEPLKFNFGDPTDAIACAYYDKGISIS